jgi:osmotically-inducible protein OsmY
VKFLLFLLVALSSWVSLQAGPAGKPATSNKKAAVLPDAQLQKAIEQRFAKSKIATNGFTVRVSNGVATLEGQTAVLQHKGTATRLARSAGARSVSNRIKVDQAARNKAAAGLKKARRAQIKRGGERDGR